MASFASFGSSTINIALVAAWKGHQQGWFCLLACSLDVLVNALAIYWVTKPGEWSHNAEGFNSSEEIDFTRRSMVPHTLSAHRTDHQQEKHQDLTSARPRQSATLPPRPSIQVQDKDAYLKPQPNVYYPFGADFTYDEAPNTLDYQTRSLPAPIIPERIHVTRSRESDNPFTRQPSSIQTPTSDLPRRNSSGAASANAGEIGFMAFLDEEAVRLPRGPVDARRNSQEEEEGRFQKAFFDFVLGKRKKSANSGVS
jgi:hypothetical protein